MRTRSARPRWLLLALAATLLAVAAAGCGGGNDSTAEPAAPSTTATEAPAATDTGATPTTESEHLSVKLALDWFPNPDHVGLYEAQDKGYWTDQNLDVELKKPSDPSAGLKLVATNKFDLAIYYESEIYFAAEKGIPVITVGSLIPNPLNSMISLADSKVKGPSTISGATIGQTGLPTDEAIISTMEKTEGLSSGDVKVVNVGFNLVPVLLSKKVDAIVGGYRNVEGVQIAMETGAEPTIIPLEDIGVPTFDELVIVANKDRLASDPAYADAVKRFLVGMVKGTQAAIDDPEGATQLMEQDVASKDYSKEFLAESVPATIDLLTPAGGTPVGCLNLDDWATYGAWMLDNELIKAPIDVSEVATNEYGDGC